MFINKKSVNSSKNNCTIDWGFSNSHTLSWTHTGIDSLWIEFNQANLVKSFSFFSFNFSEHTKIADLLSYYDKMQPENSDMSHALLSRYINYLITTIGHLANSWRFNVTSRLSRLVVNF